MLTDIIFVLDRSGSMHGLENDTIGGYNSFLEEQRKTEGEAYVTTVLFNDHAEILRSRENIRRTKDLSPQEYRTSGTTALLDAVGETIAKTEERQKYGETAKPDHTVMVIITDGYENASREYTYELVKKMIGRKKEEGWEFVFLGANIEAPETADRIGIAPTSARNFTADSDGVRTNFAAVGEMMRDLRTSGVYSEKALDRIKKK